MPDPQHLEDAARAVLRAIDDAGRNPAAHRHIMQRHQAEWPTLWKALDQLRGAVERG